MSATLVCSNQSALVSWLGTPSAAGYYVTLTGRDGHTHCAQTNATSTQLPDIHCGDTYGVTVTPYSKTCTGRPSALYSFDAGAERPKVIHPCQTTNMSSHFSSERQYPHVFFPHLQVVVLRPTSLCLRRVRTALCPGLVYQGPGCT